MTDTHHRDIDHRPATAHQPDGHKDLIHHAYTPTAEQEKLIVAAGAKEGIKVVFTTAGHDYSKGFGSCNSEWTGMVEKWVTHNEVSKKKFETFTPNDAGHGISIGLLQWNQKRGSLTDLLREWHHSDPTKFDHNFGKFSKSLMDVKFVRQADFVHNPTLYNGIKASLADGEFQHVQLSLRNKNMAHSCDIAQAHGFKSLRGRAVVADVTNQMGTTGAIEAMDRVPANRNESVRIEQLKKITGSRPHGNDRVSMIEDNVKQIWRKMGQGPTG